MSMHYWLYVDQIFFNYKQLDNIIMRNIRTKRIKTEGMHFFAGPFQESVLEIQLQKHLQCLTAIQKNQFDRASDLLHQLTYDQSIISLDNKQQNMLEFLTVHAKAYLSIRQAKYEEALKCTSKYKSSKNKEEKGSKMKTALNQLIKSSILCHLDKLDQSKEAIKNAFEAIKTYKNDEFAHASTRNLQKYNEIFIIFFDIMVLQLTKMIKFSQVLNIYKQGHLLSIQILGKEHKLTSLMHRIIQQNVKQGSLSSKNLSSKSQRGISTKKLRSKRKLKVNQNKMPLLTSKEKQMKKIYNENDELLLCKMEGNEERLTRREQTYYLKSLQRVKSIYNSRNQNRTQERSQDMGSTSKQSTLFVKMQTQTPYEYSRRRIKDIILRGRRLNKDIICMRQTEISQTEPNVEAETISHDTPDPPLETHTNNVELQHIVKEEEPKVRSNPVKQQNELTFSKLAVKVEQARETKKEECQLI